MSKLLKTSISKNYVIDWGLEEGIREIIQNALDVQTKGHKMDISYDEERETILVSSARASLDERDLLLGMTSKHNDNESIGTYGEGFKLACLALVRLGKKVFIENGSRSQVIRPLILNHEEYNEDVLMFEISNVSLDHQNLIYVIRNISPEEHELCMKTFRFDTDVEQIETEYGTIILDEEYKGCVYVGGLYVNTNQDIQYSYDLRPKYTKLDRDRNMVDWFQLRWTSSRMWAEIANRGDDRLNEIFNMMGDNCPDIEFINTFINKTSSDKLSSKFIETNSSVVEKKEVYPVTCDEDAKRARALGKTPVITNSVMAINIQKTLSTLDTLEEETKENFEILENLKQEEINNVIWASSRIGLIQDDFEFKVNIVNFHLGDHNSVMDDNSVLNIAYKNCICKFDVLHEMVKHYSLIKNREESQVWKRLLQLSMKEVS